MNPRLLPSLALSFIVGSACIAQIPNGGFETWNDMGGYDDPAQWVSFNSMSFPSGAVLVCEEGTSGGPNGSFVTMTTQTITGGTVIPGTLYSAADMLGAEGFPHAQRSATLTGQWKYSIQTGDQALITVGMSKWNTTTQMRDVIGAGLVQATGFLANWQSFSVPISYINALVPDTALIYVMSSAGLGVAGSTISVDELVFGGTAGVEDVDGPATFDLYPTSATDFVRITSGNRMASVNVFDTRGREVLQASTTGQPVMLDVSDLPAGMYMVCVRFGDTRRATRTFIKQ